VPGGAAVVERARQALSMTDRDVAPAVDWTEGARRVAAADAEGDLG
jgi:DNA-binding transcriptional regulator YdaS (Cro superfamily)